MKIVLSVQYTSTNITEVLMCLWPETSEITSVVAALQYWIHVDHHICLLSVSYFMFSWCTWFGSMTGELYKMHTSDPCSSGAFLNNCILLHRVARLLSINSYDQGHISFYACSSK